MVEDLIGFEQLLVTVKEGFDGQWSNWPMRKFLPLVSLLEVFKQHKEPPVQYEVFHLTINPFWYDVWWVLCMKVYLLANFPNAFLYCHILSKVEMHLKLV